MAGRETAADRKVTKMFWEMEGNQEADPLQDLLSQSSIDLCEVLNMDTMLQELRTGNVELTNYLMRPEVVSELCDWSMTLHKQENPDFYHISRTATETLTCPSFAKIVIASPVLKQFVEQFLNSTEEWDPLVTGHFQRLVIALSEQSSKFLNEFPNALACIERHLDVPAVGELVITLATKFASEDFAKPIVQDLAKFVAEATGNIKRLLFILRRIFEVAEQSSLSGVLGEFTNEAFVKLLIEAAKKTGDKIAKTEIFRFLVQLEGKSSELAGVIRPLVAAIPCEDPVKSDAAFQTLATIGDPKAALERLVKGPVHWALGTDLLARVKSLKSAEFLELAAAVDVIGVLKGQAEAGTISPIQLEVLSLIARYDPENARLKAEIPAPVVEKATILGVRYGGEVPIEAQGGSVNINAE